MNTIESITYLNNLGTQETPCVFIIDYLAQNSFIWKIPNIPKNVFFSFPSFNNYNSSYKSNHIKLNKKPLLFKDYDIAFSKVQEHLQQGNSFLINLTGESEITTDASLLEIFNASNAPYKLLFKESFVVFSPEPFINTIGNKIKTFPMKGTIDASIPNAEHQILSNKKELAEHATIVDLLRNDLSMIAKNVHVENYRYIDRINSNNGSLLQVSSCIEGTIQEKYKNSLGDLLFKILPAGSICGAPKPKTVEIIKEVETHTRGFYTGIMGYFDGKNLESAVMIRFIEQRQGKLYYKSGGGITTQSNVNDEYKELIQKIYVPTY